MATLLFITANLAVGFTFSTVAQNQLQAMQMSFFFLLPSILLSGFAFPFRGMPGWAQAIGEACPPRTSCASCAASCSRAQTSITWRAKLLALGAILLVVSFVAISRYRVTLD